MSRPRLAAALALALAAAPPPLPAAGIESAGFVKATWVHVENRYDAPLPVLEDTLDAVVLRARHDLRGGGGPWSWGAALDLRGVERSSEALDLLPLDLYGPAERGPLDLSASLFDDGRRAGRLSVDRLWGGLDLGPVRILAGRQPVGFGTGTFWTPTDLLSPFSATEPDREVRAGTDAVRLLWFPSATAEVGALWAPGPDFEELASLAHARFPVGPAELFVIGGRAQELPVVAASVSGEVLGAELRVEGIALRSRAHAGEAGEGPRWDTAFVGGCTYRFANGVTVIADHLVNGTGGDSLEDYARVAAVEPYSRGFIPFFGRRYLFGRVSRRLHPLVEGSLSVFRNLSDSSTLLWPTLELSLSDEASASLFLFLPQGPDRSEYGVAPLATGAFLTLHY